MNNNLLSRLSEVRQVLNGQPVQVLYNRLMQSNPDFARFVNQNRGKDLDKLAREYGLDPSIIQNILK